MGNINTWGIDGSGYFHLSYYDCSVDTCTSYDVAEADERYDTILQYDLVGMNTPFTNPLATSTATQSANVFTAQHDMELGAVSAYAPAAGCQVEAKVYALDDDDAPDEGTLIATVEQSCTLAGYHRLDLPETVTLREGQRFSVVEEISFVQDGETKWVIAAERGMSDSYAASNEQDTRFNVVANPGESQIKVEGSWADATELNDDDDLTENGDIVFGNMMIKAFGNEIDLPNEAVSVVFTNDVHCAIDRLTDANGMATNAGYAAVAGVVAEKERANGTGNVTVVDAGDAVQGGAVGTLTDGEAIVDIMNAVGYDYAVPGNHEFDYGMAQFNALVERADAQYLSCNFVDTRTGDTVLAPYAVQEYSADPGAEDADGVLKVGYVGIATPETLTKSLPSSFQDESGNYIYGFCGDPTGEKLYAAVQGAIDAAIGEGADYVVAVGHLGNEGIASQWTSRAVIANTSGIDVFIDGHSHETYVEEVPASSAGGVAANAAASGAAFAQAATDEEGGTVRLAQTGAPLANVGVLTIQPSAEEGAATSALSVDLLSAEECTAINERVRSEVDRINAELDEQLGVVVGASDVDLIARDDAAGLYVRTTETNLGDFVADAYRVSLGADIGLTNGGEMRASINAGQITMRDLLNMQPFGNQLCLVEATGQEILDALEMGARLSPEPSGAFLQVSGLTYAIDPTVASSVELDEYGAFSGVSGQRRVYDVKVDGQPIDASATYTVASHGFLLLDGSDGMTMFQDNTVLQENAISSIDAIAAYIAQNLGGTVGQEYADPAGQGRIVIAAQQGGAQQDGGEAAGATDPESPLTKLATTGDDTAPLAAGATALAFATLIGALTALRKRVRR